MPPTEKMTVMLQLLLVVTAGSLSGAVVPTRQILAIHDAAVSGLVFNEDLLFEGDASSELNCVLQCLGADGCVAFTFTSLTSPSSGKCRGHRLPMSSNYSNIVATGAASYYFNEPLGWLNQTCDTDADCPAINSKCFANRCLCTPGYFYSHKQNLSVHRCANNDLQRTFLKYPGARLFGSNIIIFGGLSLSECLERCRNYPSGVCRNIEYGKTPTVSFCHLQHDTALDVPGAWDVGLPQPLHFYQKDCA